MLLACSWSVPSLGPFGCWPFASAQGRLRCPTLAPSVPSRDRVQKGKGLQLSQAAAQAITIVILWLTQHFGAYPPTSRKCYRSTATTRMVLSMLLVSFFLPLLFLHLLFLGRKSFVCGAEHTAGHVAAPRSPDCATRSPFEVSCPYISNINWIIKINKCGLKILADNNNISYGQTESF